MPAHAHAHPEIRAELGLLGDRDVLADAYSSGPLSGI